MSAPLRPHAVIFDLDGTLIDTADEFVAVTCQLLAEYERPPLAADTIRRGVSNGSAGLVSLALGLSPGDAGWEIARNRFLELYNTTLGADSQPYPGLVELVERLAERGIPWGVVTNKLRAYAEPLMAMMPFTTPPGVLVTPDDVRHSKPHPEPLFLACKTLGVLPGRTVYVGDHKRDIDAGRSAGCQTIAAAYGYVELGDDPASWGADTLVDSSLDLADTLWERIR